MTCLCELKRLKDYESSPTSQTAPRDKNGLRSSLGHYIASPTSGRGKMLRISGCRSIESETWYSNRILLSFSTTFNQLASYGIARPNLQDGGIVTS